MTWYLVTGLTLVPKMARRSLPLLDQSRRVSSPDSVHHDVPQSCQERRRGNSFSQCPPTEFIFLQSAQISSSTSQNRMAAHMTQAYHRNDTRALLVLDPESGLRECLKSTPERPVSWWYRVAKDGVLRDIRLDQRDDRSNRSRARLIIY